MEVENFCLSLLFFFFPLLKTMNDQQIIFEKCNHFKKNKGVFKLKKVKEFPWDPSPSQRCRVQLGAGDQ